MKEKSWLYSHILKFLEGGISVSSLNAVDTINDHTDQVIVVYQDKVI